jgi:hypothetical protein
MIWGGGVANMNCVAKGHYEGEGGVPPQLKIQSEWEAKKRSIATLSMLLLFSLSPVRFSTINIFH